MHRQSPILYNMSTPTSMMQSEQILITGGCFTQTCITARPTGLHSLADAIALGAMHDSAERYPPPRCKDGQYCEQIELTMNWADAHSSQFNVHCIIAPPGNVESGCTAVAQTLAERLSTKGRLAGSFFFERGKARRDTIQSFFLTLAYQIAMNVPGMRDLINAAMINDPTLPTKIMDVQLKALIVEPFQELQKWRTHPIPITIVVVDSLHKCETLSVQSDVFMLSHQTSALAPLRFIICCPQDSELVDIFTRQHRLQHIVYLSCTGDEKDHHFNFNSRPPAPSGPARLTEALRPSSGQDSGYADVGHMSTTYSTSLDCAIYPLLPHIYPLPPQILSAEDLDSFHELSTFMCRETQNGQNTIAMEDLTSCFDQHTEVALGDYTRAMSFLCSHS